MREDVDAARHNDPAARNYLEVILAYPGVHALWMHRVAHRLWQARRPTLARVLSHIARFITGIEIHPGAKIGRGVFIDHGMGVVIGETATVGDNCLLYQGVVLGGTSLERKKRHPDLEEGVVVGAGAIVLGPIRIGKGTRIGAGSVVIKDTPPDATVVGVPGKVVAQNGKAVHSPLDHANLPDPLVQALQEIDKRLGALEAKAHDQATEPLNILGAVTKRKRQQAAKKDL
jgi:serine O-acetyltransferase